jgi:hypothetical protein
MATINQHVSDLTDLTNPGDITQITTSGDIVLSTMTLDGLITNVKFDKRTAIDSLNLTNRVVEIGCNFGYMILEEYKSMPCYKDRMSKKKRRVEQRSGRKQGLGTHFNSQITFTIVSEKDETNSYQVKLFTNGRVQIPGIGKLSKSNDELLEDILSIMCSYIADYPDTLLLNKKNPVDVQYLTPILQNYKSKTLLTKDCSLDPPKIEVVGEKRYQILPNLDLFELEKAIRAYKTYNRTPYPIASISFNPERYSGLLVKFSTPQCIKKRYAANKLIEMIKLMYHKFVKDKARPVNPMTHYSEFSPEFCTCDGKCSDDCYSNRKMMRVVRQLQTYWYLNNKSSKRFKAKLTTVKLFRSGSINLDHVNNHEQAVNIRAFIVKMITDNWDGVVYYEE